MVAITYQSKCQPIEKLHDPLEPQPRSEPSIKDARRDRPRIGSEASYRSLTASELPIQLTHHEIPEILAQLVGRLVLDQLVVVYQLGFDGVVFRGGARGVDYARGERKSGWRTLHHRREFFYLLQAVSGGRKRVKCRRNTATATATYQDVPGENVHAPDFAAFPISSEHAGNLDIEFRVTECDGRTGCEDLLGDLPVVVPLESRQSSVEVKTRDMGVSLRLVSGTQMGVKLSWT